MLTIIYSFQNRAVEKEEAIFGLLKFDVYFSDVSAVVLATSKIEYMASNAEGSSSKAT